MRLKTRKPLLGLSLTVALLAALGSCNSSPDGGGGGRGRSSSPPAAPAQTPKPGNGEDADSQAAIVTNFKEVPLDPKLQQAGGPKTFASGMVSYGNSLNGRQSGFYARPGGVISLKPSILAIHGRSGLNDEFKKMLLWFVGAGYPVLAVDLYDGSIPESYEKSDEQENAVSVRGPTEIMANIRQGVAYLVENANAAAVYAIGWDRGGEWAIESALSKAELFSAVVNYYGDPSVLETRYTDWDVPLLQVHLSDDTKWPVSRLDALQKRLLQSQKTAALHKVTGASAGFLDPRRNKTFFADLSGTSPSPHLAALQATVAWLKNPQALPVEPAPPASPPAGGMAP